MLLRINHDDPAPLDTLESCARRRHRARAPRAVAMVEPFMSTARRRPRAHDLSDRCRRCARWRSPGRSARRRPTPGSRCRWSTTWSGWPTRRRCPCCCSAATRSDRPDEMFARWEQRAALPGRARPGRRPQPALPPRRRRRDRGQDRGQPPMTRELHRPCARARRRRGRAHHARERRLAYSSTAGGGARARTAPTTFDTGESEWIVLPLAGSLRRDRATAQSFDLEGRAERLRAGHRLRLRPARRRGHRPAAPGRRVALPRRGASARCPPATAAAEDVPVELRGAGAASRQVNNFASPGAFETDRLDRCRGPGPRRATGRVSAAQARPGSAPARPSSRRSTTSRSRRRRRGRRPGPVGYQRVYTPGPGPARSTSLAEVRDRRHRSDPATATTGPTMAAPGYDLYFLNVLAGPAPARTMAFCDDPAHAWIRGIVARTKAVDPRLPHDPAPSGERR